jgi:hypothetical protein
MTSTPVAPLVGSQTPRLLLEPAGKVSSAGADAVELAALAGLHLDPWQALALEVGLAETAEGRWAAFECAVVVGRQNGKNGILEARELAGLFLFGEELVIHSAHQYQTAKEAFYRMRQLIESTPDLERRVDKFYASSLEFSVKLTTGQRLRYLARSSGGGRGFTGDCVILDEAFQLGPKEMGALLPTLSARDNPQVWYTSSAPMATSEQLHAVRRRALEGSDAALAYLEWSTPDDANVADPAAWAMSNPALGIRISEDYIAKELDALPLGEFRRERLSIPDMPPDHGQVVIDPTAWAACHRPDVEPDGPGVLAVDVNPERSAAAIGFAGFADGVPVVDLVEHSPGTRWVVARLVELSAHTDRPVVVDKTSPAGSLIDELQAAGVRVQAVSAQDQARACGVLFDLVAAQGLVHIDVEPTSRSLLDALAGAKQRPLGDAWAWSRRNSTVDVSPLVAVTLALGALLEPSESQPDPLSQMFFV